jgi:hypothetical protein
MLGCLPKPIDDELLYSILARYRTLIGTPASRLVLASAFGCEQRYAYVSLPDGLAHLADSLPAVDWRPEQLVDDFTLFPFFARFLAPQIHSEIRNRLIDGTITAHPNLRKLFRNQIIGHKTLNFCPACVESDAKRWGMPGWRRHHQMPGVFVCAEHALRLRSSGILTVPQYELIACPSNPDEGMPLPDIVSDTTAISLARNSEWLLKNPGPPTPPNVLRAGVRALLREAGWIGKSNAVGSGLRPALSEFFGSAALDALGCRPTTKNSWLGWLWQSRIGIRAHPTRYLLLLAFLGREVSDLFAYLGTDVVEERAKCPSQNRAPGRPSVKERHRANVLSVISAHPTASRAELRNIAHRPFRYLARHDPEWLKRQLPPTRSKARPIDWIAVDAALLPEMEAAITRLKTAKGRPPRITLNTIAREARQHYWLMLREDRIPLSLAIANAAVETDVDWTKRRLDWAANDMLARGDTLHWTRLARLSRLYGPCRSTLEGYARQLFSRMQEAAAQGQISVTLPPSEGDLLVGPVEPRTAAPSASHPEDQ